MEQRWQLDVAGRTSIRGRIIRALAALCFLLTVSFSLYSQSSGSHVPPHSSEKITQLFLEERWADVVRETQAIPVHDADLDYYEGSSFAHLERWDDAERALRSGWRLAPRDKRFPIELAGVTFKKKHLPAAAKWLRRGLRVDSSDSYANDFLGTVYFLEGNLEAALKFWNRIGKPLIQTVQPDTSLRIRPALLDHALAFAPASQLQREQLLASVARVEGLGVYAAPRVQLAARPDGKFDVVLNLQERNGLGGNLWQTLLSTFTGIAYQTIYPAYFNLGGSATNIASLVRWDAQKQRLGSSLSGPLHQNPKWRYSVGLDLRNENWDIRDSFTGSAPVRGALNLRREASSAEIDSINSGRWGWTAGLEFSHRDYRNVLSGSALTPSLLLAGNQLKQLTGVHYDLLRVPERRFTITTSATSQVGRIWSQPAHLFAKVQGSAAVRWFPQPESDDYETRLQVRAGGIAGDVPFDELYMLGMERDNDLWMRAHMGTHDGRKGSAPLGERYLLINSEMDKNLYSNGLIALKLSPFLDSGKISAASGDLGSPKWLWDTGAQAKVRVLGVSLVFVYGKDLRSGNNAWYFTTAR